MLLRRSGGLGRNQTVGGRKTRLGRICSQCQRQVNIFGAVPVRTFPLTRSAIFTFHFTALQTLVPVQAREPLPPRHTHTENCHNYLLSNCQSDIEMPTMFLTFALFLSFSPHLPLFLLALKWINLFASHPFAGSFVQPNLTAPSPNMWPQKELSRGGNIHGSSQQMSIHW